MSQATAEATHRILAAGTSAFLVDLDGPDARRRLHQALLADPPAGITELVPAKNTILALCRRQADVAPAARRVDAMLRAGLAGVQAATVEPTEIRVRYDGADLAGVARILGITPDEVVARHTGQLWTVEFAGFMPGFGYLMGERGGMEVPRLSSPRTRIPPGSVALADGFTGLYPQASPGGWQLIGTTDAVLWDEDRTPPALLVPGARIRFVEEDR